MFYTFIKRKRDAWFASESCTVQALIDYMKRKGALRDVQIDAIRTYLFLKIAGGNRSLYTLLTTGFSIPIPMHIWMSSRFPLLRAII